MELHIVSLNQKEQIDVIWVELQTMTGNIVIQPEHAPMILSLQPNSQIRFGFENSKQRVVNISSGFAHITRASVTILISSDL